MGIAKVVFFKEDKEKFKKARSYVTLNDGETFVPKKIIQLTEDFCTFSEYRASVQNVLFSYEDYATWENVARKSINNKNADFCYKVYLGKQEVLYTVLKHGKIVCDKVNFDIFVDYVNQKLC